MNSTIKKKLPSNSNLYKLNSREGTFLHIYFKFLISSFPARRLKRMKKIMFLLNMIKEFQILFYIFHPTVSQFFNFQFSDSWATPSLTFYITKFLSVFNPISILQPLKKSEKNSVFFELETREIFIKDFANFFLIFSIIQLLWLGCSLKYLSEIQNVKLGYIFKMAIIFFWTILGEMISLSFLDLLTFPIYCKDYGGSLGKRSYRSQYLGCIIGGNSQGFFDSFLTFFSILNLIFSFLWIFFGKMANFNSRILHLGTNLR